MFHFSIHLKTTEKWATVLSVIKICPGWCELTHIYVCVRVCVLASLLSGPILFQLLWIRKVCHSSARSSRSRFFPRSFSQFREIRQYWHKYFHKTCPTGPDKMELDIILLSPNTGHNKINIIKLNNAAGQAKIDFLDTWKCLEKN